MNVTESFFLYWVEVAYKKGSVSEKVNQLKERAKRY